MQACDLDMRSFLARPARLPSFDRRFPDGLVTVDVCVHLLAV